MFLVSEKVGDVTYLCVGHAPDNPKYFKVFRYGADLRAAGFRPVSGDPLMFGAWSDYLDLRTQPPSPETPDEWLYDYLDKLDETAR